MTVRYIVGITIIEFEDVDQLLEYQEKKRLRSMAEPTEKDEFAELIKKRKASV